MHFTKMQGCGNDYIFADGIKEHFPRGECSKLARQISDRHFGVGADGLIIVRLGQQADFEMEMYNADGSRGEMCGNGIRCAAKYVHDKKYIEEKSFRIESKGLVRKVVLLDTDNQVQAYMGEARLGEVFYVAGKWKLYPVSMGNPHGVVFVRDLQRLQLSSIGPFLEKATCFPEGANIEFVKIEDKSTISMRVWERGSGETLACGTGACAAAAVCMQKGLTDRQITVKLLGGELQVVRDLTSREMLMTGPAETICEGEYPAFA